MAYADRRAKVYQLRGDGEWQDCGTGFVHAAGQGSHDFVVVRETAEEADGSGGGAVAAAASPTTPPVLITIPITRHDVYRRQPDTTIIMWERREQDGGNEYALSFQTVPGCDAMWRGICDILGLPHAATTTDDGGREEEEEEQEEEEEGEEAAGGGKRQGDHAVTLGVGFKRPRYMSGGAGGDAGQAAVGLGERSEAESDKERCGAGPAAGAEGGAGGGVAGHDGEGPGSGWPRPPASLSRGDGGAEGGHGVGLGLAIKRRRLLGMGEEGSGGWASMNHTGWGTAMDDGEDDGGAVGGGGTTHLHLSQLDSASPSTFPPSAPRDVDDGWRDGATWRGKVRQFLRARREFHPTPMDASSHATGQMGLFGVVADNIIPFATDVASLLATDPEDNVFQPSHVHHWGGPDDVVWMLMNERGCLRDALAAILAQIDEGTSFDAPELTGMMQGLLTINKQELMSLLVSDDWFPLTVACLEAGKSSHLRQAIAAGLHLHEPVPFTSTRIRNLVIELYRINFLKDNALSRHAPESALGNLTNHAFFVQTEVVAMMTQGRKSPLMDVLAVLKELTTSELDDRAVFAATMAALQASMQAGVEDDRQAGGDGSVPPTPPTAAATAGGCTHAAGAGHPQARVVAVPPAAPTVVVGTMGKREMCLRWVHELLTMLRQLPMNTRAACLQMMCEAPGFHGVAAMHPTLMDRHATRNEVILACEILTLLSTHDASVLRDYSLQPQRRHIAAPTKPTAVALPTLDTAVPPTAEGLVPKPLAAAAGVTEPPGAASSGDGTGMATPKVTVMPDDGHSIRLWDKVTGEGLLDPTILCTATVPALSTFAVSHRSAGEHGSLVIAPTTGSTLLHVLVWRLVEDPDTAVQTYAAEMIRTMLDAETASATARDAIVKVWYDHYCQWVVQPFIHPALPDIKPTASVAEVVALVSATPHLSRLGRSGSCDGGGEGGVGVACGAGSPAMAPPFTIHQQNWLWEHVVRPLDARCPGWGHETQSSKHSKALVADLLAWCITHHGTMAKYIVMRTSLMPKVCRLLRYDEAHVVLAGIKFLKACLSNTDTFYPTWFTRHNLFTPLLTAFIRFGHRDGAATSAMLDLFDLLLNVPANKPIVDTVVQMYAPVLRLACHIPIVRRLLGMEGMSKAAPPLHDSVDGHAMLPTLRPGGGGGAGESATVPRRGHGLGRGGLLGDDDDDSAYFDSDEDGPYYPHNGGGGHNEKSPQGSGGDLARAEEEGDGVSVGPPLPSSSSARRLEAVSFAQLGSLLKEGAATSTNGTGAGRFTLGAGVALLRPLGLASPSQPASTTNYSDFDFVDDAPATTAATAPAGLHPSGNASHRAGASPSLGGASTFLPRTAVVGRTASADGDDDAFFSGGGGRPAVPGAATRRLIVKPRIEGVMLAGSTSPSRAKDSAHPHPPTVHVGPKDTDPPSAAVMDAFSHGGMGGGPGGDFGSMSPPSALPTRSVPAGSAQMANGEGGAAQPNPAPAPLPRSGNQDDDHDGGGFMLR